MSTTGYVFDAYGTLFDVHAAMRAHAGALGPKWGAISATWRAKQLEYAWVRGLMGSYCDFWRITAESLDHALALHEVDADGLREALLDAYRTLDAYPDAREALERLGRSGARIAILSNGSPEMLSAAVASARFDTLVDDVFSVDAVKAYKTAPEVYRMVTDAWDIKAGKIAFVSANRWDIAGAARFGFRCVWVNRAGAPDEYASYAPERIIASLDAL
ncbi:MULTISPECIES: haloacid dehalogenase type II [unclassified Roseitalea]|uniref:haloacid dehalogenase type II n=1 Tax=unclassified Roseitalea TaxID=2639107 RepID=UPI00273E7146|nr:MULTISPECIES: haloacid dehalogenase type II [unclassified Roseitalea]